LHPLLVTSESHNGGFKVIKVHILTMTLLVCVTDGTGR